MLQGATCQNTFSAVEFPLFPHLAVRRRTMKALIAVGLTLVLVSSVSAKVPQNQKFQRESETLVKQLAALEGVKRIAAELRAICCCTGQANRRALPPEAGRRGLVQGMDLSVPQSVASR